ncbi:hypothetical protein PINS_up011438 [Pythium insidiosum]|nr:hypothetical protein PINS_up011438 [Pythium insidiosum]
MFLQSNERQDALSIDSPGRDMDHDALPASSDVMTLEEIRQMTVQLCGALSFLHDQGVIHADLKPENVVRAAEPTRQHVVKLVDFGNCIERAQVALYEEDDSSLSRGFDIQTLTYRAPEVAAGLSISPAMDLWSLGCVLFECASGEPLLQFDTATAGPTELLDQIEALQLQPNGQTLGAVAPDYRAVRSSLSQRRVRSTEPPARSSMAERLQRAYDRRRTALAEDDADTTMPRDWQAFTDLLVCLLDVDPSSRISAREVFLHPFVQCVFPFQLVFAPPPALPPVDTTDALSSLTSPTTTVLSSESSPRHRTPKPKRRRNDRRSSPNDGDEQASKQQKKAKRVALQQALRMIPSAATLRHDDSTTQRTTR